MGFEVYSVLATKGHQNEIAVSPLMPNLQVLPKESSMFRSSSFHPILFMAFMIVLALCLAQVWRRITSLPACR